MKEQFDKELRNHIKDTFGVFDDHLADDGWRKLNDRKKKKRRAFFFWYLLPSGIAASIALFLFLNQSQEIPFQKEKTEEKTETLAEQKPYNSFKKEDSEKLNLDEKSGKLLENSNQPKLNQEENLSFKKSDLNLEIDQNKSNSETTLNNKNSTLALLNKAINQKIIDSDSLIINKYKIALAEGIPEVETTVKIDDFSNIAEYSMERIQEISVQEKSYIPSKSNLNQNVVAKSFDKPSDISQKLATLIPAKADTKIEKPIQNSKKFKIGIDANTYVNFSESGLNDKLNLGLGVISEIKLTKQLSINTGVSLNTQNSTFNGGRNTKQDFLNSSIAATSFAAVPNAQVTIAKLVGLDIPLNLKYAVKFGKTNSFISSGFSSYSVINEKYINEFSVINYFFSSVTTSNVTSVNNNPEGQFSYFKFARTLDISVGILYPFSKKTTLSIEPFMKYPLSGLGYQDLKIGSSGISFKMNFGK